MDKKVINYIPHFKYISEELEKEISQEKRKKSYMYLMFNCRCNNDDRIGE